MVNMNSEDNLTPDFSLHSRFNEQKGFTEVKFAANAKLLEVELNEMQDIQNHQRRQLTRTMYPNGLFYGATTAYSAGTFRLENAEVVLDGDIIPVDQLTLQTTTVGAHIYFRKQFRVVTHSDQIKRDGNLQSTTNISNDMLDTRYPRETSRRIQLQYNLTTSNTAAQDTEYLELGYISTPLAEGTGTATTPIFVSTALKFMPMWMFQASFTIDGGSFSDEYTRLIDGGYFHENSKRVLDGGDFSNG